MLKVLISDEMSNRAEAIFKERGIEVDVITGMNHKELEACIGEYHGLAVRSSTKVNLEIIKAELLKKDLRYYNRNDLYIYLWRLEQERH